MCAPVTPGQEEAGKQNGCVDVFGLKNTFFCLFLFDCLFLLFFFFYCFGFLTYKLCLLLIIVFFCFVFFGNVYFLKLLNLYRLFHENLLLPFWGFLGNKRQNVTLTGPAFTDTKVELLINLTFTGGKTKSIKKKIIH